MNTHLFPFFMSTPGFQNKSSHSRKNGFQYKFISPSSVRTLTFPALVQWLTSQAYSSQGLFQAFSTFPRSLDPSSSATAISQWSQLLIYKASAQSSSPSNYRTYQQAKVSHPLLSCLHSREMQRPLHWSRMVILIWDCSPPSVFFSSLTSEVKFVQSASLWSLGL